MTWSATRFSTSAREGAPVHNADARVLPFRQPAGPIPGAAPVPQVSDS